MTLERIRAGDEGALDELVREVWTPLVRHLTHIAGSRDVAQDAAQEALVRLWERRERWEAGSARALVYRIGRNVAFDAVRRAHVRRRSLDEDVGRPRACPTPDEDLVSSEMAARVAAACEGLSVRRREVFELVRFGGFSFQEVAEALDLSVQTVANHMSAALRHLRADLADLVEEAPHGGEGRGARSSRDG